MNNEEFVKEYFEKETYKPENFDDQGNEVESPEKEGSPKKVNQTKKEREYIEIMKSPFQYTKGWLLIDYPLNY